MKQLFFWGLLGILSGPVFLAALGQDEDPNDTVIKTFDLPDVVTLEIRGEVQFTLAPGPKPEITVETTRALMSQLAVSDWWGNATVAIESGLMGPREKGGVKVSVALPSLGRLTVRDRSSGSGTWPLETGQNQKQLKLEVYEESSVTMTCETRDLDVEVSWLSSAVLRGKADQLTVNLRHQGKVMAKDFDTGETHLYLDEESSFEGGPTALGTGIVRHGSRVILPPNQSWSTLEMKEGAVREDQPQP